jgi:hypothetical protein
MRTLFVLMSLSNFALANNAPWLSTLRQKDTKTCVWESVAISGQVETLASFPNTCAGATVVRAKSGKHALVQFGGNRPDGNDVAGPGSKPPFKEAAARGTGELWLVKLDVPKAQTERLIPPGETKFDVVGFDDKDNVIGLSVMTLPRKLKVTKAKDKEGETVDRFQFNNKSYQMPEVTQGVRALAQALKYVAKNKWVEVETAPTTTAWDFGAGVAELKIAKQWEKDANPEGGWTEKSNDSIPALIAGLVKHTPQGSDSGTENWKVMESSNKNHGHLAIWQEVGEFRNDSGLLVYSAPAGKEFLPLPKIDYNRSVRPKITFRSDYCLIVTSGTASHPRVYDMRTGELVHKSDDRFSVSFWE